MSEPRFSTTELALGEDVQVRSKLVHVSEPGTATETAEAISPLRILRAQAEIKGIQHALKLTGWNRKQAARLLKISYRGLLYKIRQHQIKRAATESS